MILTRFSCHKKLGLRLAHKVINVQSNLNSSNTDDLVLESLRDSSDTSIKQIFKEMFLFYREVVCCVYSLESPHRGDSNEYT